MMETKPVQSDRDEVIRTIKTIKDSHGRFLKSSIHPSREYGLYNQAYLRILVGNSPVHGR